MARAGKGSSKAERDALRQEMLVSGCSLELIATEMERRWGIRPREAYRHAHGWSQDEVAARFTEVADRTGGDRNLGSDGRPLPAQAPMIGTRIGEYERWPHGGRRPSPYVLTVLATVLGTTVERLLDYDDHRKMPDQERTVLAAVLAAANAPVALPPEPRTAPGPSSRAPLGRLTELLTSSDPATGQPGSATGAEGTEKDRAGRAGALTAEQWSAARRLVERGFGLTEDGVADPEADAGNVSGASAAPTARGGKTRSPARRPRAGTPRRTERAAGRGAQPDETDQTGPAVKTGSAAPAVHAGPAAQTGPTTPTETGALCGQAVPTQARAQTEPAVPTDTSGRTGSAAQTGRAEKPGPAAAADPTAKVWPGAPAGSDVDEHPEAAAGPDVAGLLVPDAGPQVGAEARRAEYVDALDRLGATDLPGALRRSAAAAAGTEGEPSDA
ncbi:MAG TPA: hypothetical protein VLM05_13020, partial [Mycobacteriales bacterium]|nr:hypothetical protein [Mycobacteriales bacterium]